MNMLPLKLLLSLKLFDKCTRPIGRQLVGVGLLRHHDNAAEVQMRPLHDSLGRDWGGGGSQPSHIGHGGGRCEVHR